MVLYIILGLCTLAVVGVAIFAYRHIRRHLAAKPARTESGAETETGKTLAPGAVDQHLSNP